MVLNEDTQPNLLDKLSQDTEVWEISEQEMQDALDFLQWDNDDKVIDEFYLVLWQEFEKDPESEIIKGLCKWAIWYIFDLLENEESSYFGETEEERKEDKFRNRQEMFMIMFYMLNWYENWIVDKTKFQDNLLNLMSTKFDENFSSQLSIYAFETLKKDNADYLEEIKKQKEEKKKWEEWIDKITSDIDEKIKDKIEIYMWEYAKDWSFVYKENDIKLLQWLINEVYGTSIQIDGKIGNRNYLSTNTENEKLTNIYINRLEILYRNILIERRRELKWNNFDNLLYIPNLEMMIWVLDQKWQEKVLWEFFEFYLEKVKKEWMSFENNIWEIMKNDEWNSALVIILNLMITKQQYLWQDKKAKDIYNLTDEQKKKYWEDVSLDVYLDDIIGQLKNSIVNGMQQLVEQNDYLLYTNGIKNAEKWLEEYIKVANDCLWITDQDILDYKNEKKITFLPDDEISLFIWQKLLSEWKIDKKWKEKIAEYFKQKLLIADVYGVMSFDYKEEISAKIMKIFKDDEIEVYFDNWKIIKQYYTYYLEWKNLVSNQFWKAYDVLEQIKEYPNWVSFQYLDESKWLDTYKNDEWISSYRYLTKEQLKNLEQQKLLNINKWKTDVEILKELWIHLMIISYWENKKIINIWKYWTKSRKKGDYEYDWYSRLYYNEKEEPFKWKNKIKFYLKNDLEWNKNSVWVYETSCTDFFLTCEDENWIVHVYEKVSKYQDQRKETTNYAKWEKTESLIISNISETNDAVQNADLFDIQNDFKEWWESISGISNMFSIFNKKELSSDDLIKARELSVKFQENGLWYMEWQVSKMKSYIEKLKLSLWDQIWSYQTEQEKAYNNLLIVMDSMIEMFDVEKWIWWKSNMRLICENIMTEAFFSNDSLWKRWNHRMWEEKWWITVLTFIWAIAVTIWTAWALAPLWFVGILAGSALSIWWSVVAQEVLGILDDYAIKPLTSNITIDGQEYKIESVYKWQFMLWEEWKITSWEYLWSLSKQFLVWTLTQTGFMCLWKVIWNYLSKYAATNPWSNLTKLMKIIKPRQFHPKFNWSQAMQWVSHQVSESFAKKLFFEVWEEAFQEAMETWAEKINWPLWTLVTIYNCISSQNWVNLFIDAEITWWKTIFSEDNKNITTKFDYNAKNINSVISHFQNEWYEIVSQENWVLRMEQEIFWSKHSIEFTNSELAYELRNWKNILIWSHFNVENKNFEDLFQENKEDKCFDIKEWNEKYVDEWKKNIMMKWGYVIRNNSDWSFLLISKEWSMVFNTNKISKEQKAKNFEESLKLNYNVYLKKIIEEQKSITEKDWDAKSQIETPKIVLSARSPLEIQPTQVWYTPSQIKTYQKEIYKIKQEKWDNFNPQTDLEWETLEYYKQNERTIKLKEKIASYTKWTISELAKTNMQEKTGEQRIADAEKALLLEEWTFNEDQRNAILWAHEIEMPSDAIWRKNALRQKKKILNGELIKDETWNLVKNKNYIQNQDLFSEVEQGVLLREGHCGLFDKVKGWFGGKKFVSKLWGYDLNTLWIWCEAKYKTKSWSEMLIVKTNQWYQVVDLQNWLTSNVWNIGMIWNKIYIDWIFFLEFDWEFVSADTEKKNIIKILSGFDIYSMKEWESAYFLKNQLQITKKWSEFEISISGKTYTWAIKISNDIFYVNDVPLVDMSNYNGQIFEKSHFEIFWWNHLSDLTNWENIILKTSYGCEIKIEKVNKKFVLYVAWNIFWPWSLELKIENWLNVVYIWWDKVVSFSWNLENKLVFNLTEQNIIDILNEINEDYTWLFVSIPVELDLFLNKKDRVIGESSYNILKRKIEILEEIKKIKDRQVFYKKYLLNYNDNKNKTFSENYWFNADWSFDIIVDWKNLTCMSPKIYELNNNYNNNKINELEKELESIWDLSYLTDNKTWLKDYVEKNGFRSLDKGDKIYLDWEVYKIKKIKSRNLWFSNWYVYKLIGKDWKTQSVEFKNIEDILQYIEDWKITRIIEKDKEINTLSLSKNVKRIEKKYEIKIPNELKNNLKSTTEYYKTKINENSKSDIVLEEIEENTELFDKIMSDIDSKFYKDEVFTIDDNFNAKKISQEFITKYTNELYLLPSKLQLAYIEWICIYFQWIEDCNNLKNKLKNKKLSDKNILWKLNNRDLINLKDYDDSKVEMEQVWDVLVFHVYDEDLYQYIRYWNDSTWSSAWFSTTINSKITWNKNIKINVIDETKNDGKTRSHELSHALNKTTFKEYVFWWWKFDEVEQILYIDFQDNPINRAKDEIIAFLVWWDDYYTALYFLKKDKWTYDYFWHNYWNKIESLESDLIYYSKIIGKEKDGLKKSELQTKYDNLLIEYNKLTYKYDYLWTKHKEKVEKLIETIEKFENKVENNPELWLTKEKVRNMFTLYPYSKREYIAGLYETKLEKIKSEISNTIWDYEIKEKSILLWQKWIAKIDINWNILFKTEIPGIWNIESVDENWIVKWTEWKAHIDINTWKIISSPFIVESEIENWIY